jgi:hypothetical protein
VPGRPLRWILLATWVAFLPLAPAVFRHSRVPFIHLDHYLDPDGAGDPPRGYSAGSSSSRWCRCSSHRAGTIGGHLGGPVR